MGENDYMLKVEGVYSNLTVICDHAQKFAVDAGFDTRAVYAVQMAVDEACCNIIKHGYGGEGKGTIYLDFVKLDDAIKVTIRDDGKAFDPASVPMPDFYSPIEERPEGGLGLFLMQKLMDEVQFSFADGDKNEFNTLVMIKRFDSKT